MIAQLANRPVLRIAMVHLISKKRQTAVAMLGVMFGITVFIFQAGLITGLQIFMLDKIVNNSPHVHLYNEPEKNPPSILSKIFFLCFFEIFYGRNITRIFFFVLVFDCTKNFAFARDDLTCVSNNYHIYW